MDLVHFIIKLVEVVENVEPDEPDGKIVLRGFIVFNLQWQMFNFHIHCLPRQRVACTWHNLF